MFVTVGFVERSCAVCLLSAVNMAVEWVFLTLVLRLHSSREIPFRAVNA